MIYFPAENTEQTMNLSCEERPSDSPYIERVWRSQNEYSGTFISMAETHWEMVITRHRGKTTLTVRGPETRATPAYCPADAEFIGIQFKEGAFMPSLPAGMLMDRRDVNLPEASHQSFWLNGAAWPFFDYENAECFVERLVREALLVCDSTVDAVLQAQPVKEISLRTVQRRFLQATGLTHSALCQIKRARYAISLLKDGVSILDTVAQAGYADQPHLTRSLMRYMGHTPGQVLGEGKPMSFLFKTPPF